MKGVLILLLSGFVAALAAWGQQLGPMKREIPLSWSPKLRLASLKDIDAALLGPFFGEPSSFRAQPTGKPGVWVTVRNCQDYLDVRAFGNFELDPEISDISYGSVQAEGLRCFALQLLKNARPAHKTFLADLHFTANVGNLLPPDLGMVVSPDEEEEVRAADEKGISWKQYDPELRIQVHGKDEFTAKGDLWEANVASYARGDFDGNGIEELLLRKDSALLQGTYRDHCLFILTRTSNQGPLRVVREIE
jgi:hypothetical protein